VKDAWNAGELYEPYVGRWSRLVARKFLPWLGVAHGSRWLDVGCGTGALTQAILETQKPSGVLGVDPSSDFIAYVRQQLTDARAHFEIGSAEKIHAESGQFDAIVSALVINFLPRPERAVIAMCEAVKPRGIVGAYVWDYVESMQFMRYFWDAAIELDPEAVAFDEGRRFPLCQPDALEKLFRNAGLREVETRAIDVETTFSDFDDFWRPFLGGQGPAPSYLMSLQDEHRERLRQRLQAMLPRAVDGSIPLIARAWAVRGSR